jgi:DNA-binding MarR family transcriptional regulator
MDSCGTRKQTITQQLRILFRAVQAHSRQVEKTCGLSSAQLWMLYEVSLSNGVSVSDLATRLSLHRSTSSNMLDKLEKKNLITRDRNRADQRTVQIYLTESGKELLDLAPSPPEGYLSNTLSKLDDRELTDLENSLQVFIDALHFEDSKASLTPIVGSDCKKR